MDFTFKDKRISGILSVLPEQEVLFDDEVENYTFPVKQTMRLKKIMGFEKHRIAKEGTATSDLCAAGLQELLDRNLISKDEIGALVVVTITPDHFIPHVGTILQGRFGLDQEVFCIDILQGCVGYVMGLVESFMLLDHMEPGKKVLLFNGDILSQKVSKQDRGSYPLIGDAVSVTVVENASGVAPIQCCIRMDGSRGEALEIPAGGSRMPCSEKTAAMFDDGDGNIRCLDNLHMDGTAVYNFVQTDVPPLIAKVLSKAGVSKDDIAWYLFHQPNKFMLEKLAEQLDVPYEKVPMNIVECFGNPSGASIPLVTSYNLSDALTSKEELCCLSGFGAGLCCGAMVMKLGNLDFCEVISSQY